MTVREGTTRGFKRGGALIAPQVRKVSESRGFAVARVLTHWPEIAGPEIAAIARPVEVSHPRHGLGATLSVLTTGAQAPILEMQKERLRERVNSAYGYNAIARIRITQTAPSGFADGMASFAHGPAPAAARPAPDELTMRKASDMAGPVADSGLRAAIETLARNVLSRRNT